MNATFFLLGAACLGADPAPAPIAVPAPAIVASAAGCGGCDAAPSCDTGCGSTKMGFFSKLKARLHCHKSSSCAAPACAAPCASAPVACAPAPVACAPAPVACAPAPVACAPACTPSCKPHCGSSLFSGFTTSACSSHKCSLFGSLRSKFKHSNACDSCGAAPACGSAYSGCSTGPAMVAPGGPIVPPKDMPIPPKEDPKPKTTTLAPIIPLTPAEFTGTAGKY